MTRKIKDLHLAAYLLAIGFMPSTSIREGRTCWFCFDISDELLASIDAYWSGEGMCSARTYADALRTLKDQIFSMS